MHNQGVCPAIELQDVSAGYDRAEVLHEISIILRKGEIVVLLGPNGCGKSTALRTIIGFLHPNKGRVLLHGDDVSRMSVEDMVARGVSLVPQGGRAFPTLSVVENLELGGYTLRSLEEVELRMEIVYELFPCLKERLLQGANTLSGGERQMLAMGRSLMPDPSVLLLDEPTLGLAPIPSRDLIATVQNIREETGTSILLVEQKSAVALPIADRVYVMRAGQIVFESDDPCCLLDKGKLLKLYMS